MTVKRKKPKVIICDLDDVIYDFLSHLCWLYNKINDTHISEADITEWEFEGVRVKSADGSIATGEGLKKIMHRFEDHGLYTIGELVQDSKEAVDIIKSFGYKFIILTARPDKFGEQTYQYLLKKNIQYDELIFNWDKVRIINELSKKYDIIMFIDDKYKTIAAVNEHCKVETVCLVSKAHNENIKEDAGIKRVGDLFECVRYLKSLND